MCEYEVQKVKKHKNPTVANPVDTSKEDEIILLKTQLAERDELIAARSQAIEQHCQTIQELRTEVVGLNETISKL